MKYNFMRKVNLAAFFLFAFAIVLISPSFSRNYDEIHGITSKMVRIGMINELPSDASKEVIYDYITSEATYSSSLEIAYKIAGATFEDKFVDFSTCLPYLRSDMTEGFTENGVFVFPDNFRTAMSSDYLFSSAHVYEMALRLLGFNSSDFGTTPESIIDFAISKKFGFRLPVELNDDLLKGEAACIFYEALFIPAKATGFSLARIISETSSEKKEIFVNNGMIEDMPSFVPFYTLSPYEDESFTHFVKLPTASSDKKTEWSCTYVMADSLCYDTYKNSMASSDWILDTEYTRTNQELSETCALYYKVIDGREDYCLIRFNEILSKIDIWIGV